MGYIRIPFLSTSEQGRPLQEALDLAASQAGISQHTAAMMMTYFFEGIANEVTKGHIVRIPGFGVFAPVLDERKQYLARRGGPKCLPRFSAAKGFRMQVMLTAPASRAGKVALATHRSNHRCSQNRYTTSRVFASMKAMRDQISLQLCVDRPRTKKP
ncbi:MAG: hypothetical protein DRJ50_15500 [Actinobacteria bacterium]|nr:MAG: hypothetical protein DRJ50_15500 [Actinomycetota bacterium]